MDLSPGWVMSSLVVGSLGFAFFLYGKKQTRLPQLFAGLALMADSCVGSPLWMAIGAALVIGAMWAAVRAGK